MVCCTLSWKQILYVIIMHTLIAAFFSRDTPGSGSGFRFGFGFLRRMYKSWLRAGSRCLSPLHYFSQARTLCWNTRCSVLHSRYSLRLSSPSG
ncbi:hypothetical protein DY000_02025868 [Brassica cretica]|uniref:Secreted protein n=1 Tax=Brassica cretica TaxID=69181 RepID=A0ABQ7E8D2_BRACR|nr:hypothetical protein DY000_02025868 [Brassica cretica]